MAEGAEPVAPGGVDLVVTIDVDRRLPGLGAGNRGEPHDLPFFRVLLPGGQAVATPVVGCKGWFDPAAPRPSAEELAAAAAAAAEVEAAGGKKGGKKDAKKKGGKKDPAPASEEPEAAADGSMLPDMTGWKSKRQLQKEQREVAAVEAEAAGPAKAETMAAEAEPSVGRLRFQVTVPAAWVQGRTAAIALASDPMALLAVGSVRPVDPAPTDPPQEGEAEGELEEAAGGVRLQRAPVFCEAAVPIDLSPLLMPEAGPGAAAACSLDDLDWAAPTAVSASLAALPPDSLCPEGLCVSGDRAAMGTRDAVQRLKAVATGRSTGRPRSPDAAASVAGHGHSHLRHAHEGSSVPGLAAVPFRLGLQNVSVRFEAAAPVLPREQVRALKPLRLRCGQLEGLPLRVQPSAEAGEGELLQRCCQPVMLSCRLLEPEEAAAALALSAARGEAAAAAQGEAAAAAQGEAAEGKDVAQGSAPLLTGGLSRTAFSAATPHASCLDASLHSVVLLGLLPDTKARDALMTRPLTCHVHDRRGSDAILAAGVLKGKLPVAAVLRSIRSDGSRGSAADGAVGAAQQEAKEEPAAGGQGAAVAEAMEEQQEEAKPAPEELVLKPPSSVVAAWERRLANPGEAEPNGAQDGVPLARAQVPAERVTGVDADTLAFLRCAAETAAQLHPHGEAALRPEGLLDRSEERRALVEAFARRADEQLPQPTRSLLGTDGEEASDGENGGGVVDEAAAARAERRRARLARRRREQTQPPVEETQAGDDGKQEDVADDQQAGDDGKQEDVADDQQAGDDEKEQAGGDEQEEGVAGEAGVQHPATATAPLSDVQLQEQAAARARAVRVSDRVLVVPRRRPAPPLGGELLANLPLALRALRSPSPFGCDATAIKIDLTLRHPPFGDSRSAEKEGDRSDRREEPVRRVVVCCPAADAETASLVLDTVHELNRRALGPDVRSVFAYELSEAEKARVESGDLDLVCGWQVVDDNWRVMVVEGRVNLRRKRQAAAPEAAPEEAAADDGEHEGGRDEVDDADEGQAGLGGPEGDCVGSDSNSSDDDDDDDDSDGTDSELEAAIAGTASLALQTGASAFTTGGGGGGGGGAARPGGFHRRSTLARLVARLRSRWPAGDDGATLSSHKLLVNMAIGFRDRLYTSLGPCLHTVRLRGLAAREVLRPALYDPGKMSAGTGEAMQKLLLLRRCQAMAHAKALRLFPLAEHMVSLDQELGAAVSRSDQLGPRAAAASAQLPEGQAFDALAGSSIRLAATLDPRASGRLPPGTDALDAERARLEAKTDHDEGDRPQRNRRTSNKMATSTGNADFEARLRQRRAAGNGLRAIRKNKEAVRAASEQLKLARLAKEAAAGGSAQELSGAPVTAEGAVYAYGGQRLNARAWQRKQIVKRLASDRTATYTYSKDYAFGTVAPVDEEEEAAAAREADVAKRTLARGFLPVGKGTTGHAKAPAESRADELRQPWQDPRELAAVEAARAAGDGGWKRTRAEAGTFGYTGPDGQRHDGDFFRSVHLAGDAAAAEQAAAEQAEKDAWQRKVVVDKLHFQPHVPPQRPTAQDRARPMLDGPVRKAALRIVREARLPSGKRTAPLDVGATGQLGGTGGVGAGATTTRRGQDPSRWMGRTAAGDPADFRVGRVGTGALARAPASSIRPVTNAEKVGPKWAAR